MENLIGQKIGGYKLESLIIRGKHGEVYRGKQIYLSEASSMVAIKVLQPQEHPYDCLEAKFLTNPNISSHPNIIQFINFGIIDSGIPYIIMEYAPNNLHERHPEGTILDLSIIVHYVKQIASALQCIHNEKIIHCDVRPENILIREDGSIALCDFSLSVKASEAPDGNTQGGVGNPRYMAPEQIHKERSYYASDQYALGLMVYEWLCGENPSKSNTAETTEIPLLGKKAGNTLASVQETVHKAIHNDPTKRFTKIQDFAEKLEKDYIASLEPTPSNAPVNGNTAKPLGQSDLGSTANGQLQLPYHVGVEISEKQKKPQLLPEKHQSSLELKNQRRREFNALVWRSVRMFPAVATLSTLFLTGIKIIPKLQTSPAKISRFSQGQTLYVYHGHTANVNGVAWSHDNRVASGSFDGTIQLWDITAGDHIQTLLYTNRSQWEVTPMTGDNLLNIKSPYPEHINDIAWSSDGKYIAFCYGNQLMVWEVEAKISKLNPYPLWHYHDVANAVSWSSNYHGYRLASASYDGTLHIWEKNQSGAMWKKLEISNSIAGSSSPANDLSKVFFDVALSQDGMHLAACSTGPNAKIWIYSIASPLPISAPSPDNVTPSPGFQDGVLSVDWAPFDNDEHIACGFTSSYDINSIRIFDTSTLDAADQKSLSAPVRRVAWRDDGRYIAAGTRSGIIEVLSVANGQTFTNDEAFPYKGHISQQEPVYINALAWSHNGQMIASGGTDGIVRVWQAI